MTRNRNIITDRFGRPFKDRKPKLIGPKPPQPVDNGVRFVRDRETGEAFKVLSNLGMLRLIASLIKDRGGTVTVAISDIENFPVHQIHQKYDPNIDAIDISVIELKEPDKGESDDTVEEN